MERSAVQIDAGYLARVCPAGVDPERFAQWLGNLAASPDGLVIAQEPDKLGVAYTMTLPVMLGGDYVATGAYLLHAWPMLEQGQAWAKAKGCKAFLYPLQADNPRAAAIARKLKQDGFAPWQTIHRKEL